MTDHEKLREAIKRLRRQSGNYADDSWEAAINVVCAAAESTLPKTKMVEVWHVEFFFNGRPCVHAFESREAASHYADVGKGDDHRYCIRVTGPHQQEVPCD